MRTLILLLVLASGFGLAALWQTYHVEQLRAAQQEAWELADGRIARTESGLIEEGWATVIVGVPSGAAPVRLEHAARAPGPRGSGPALEAPPDQPPPATEELPPLGDFEMEVQPGQTLSGIAHAHYGTAPAALVQALAAYNGIEDPDALRAGAWVLLPERERLSPAEE